MLATASFENLILAFSVQAVFVNNSEATPSLARPHYLALLHLFDSRTGRYAHHAYRFGAEPPFMILGTRALVNFYSQSCFSHSWSILQSVPCLTCAFGRHRFSVLKCFSMFQPLFWVEVTANTAFEPKLNVNRQLYTINFPTAKWLISEGICSSWIYSWISLGWTQPTNLSSFFREFLTKKSFPPVSPLTFFVFPRMLQMSSQLPLTEAAAVPNGVKFAFASGLAVKDNTVVISYGAGDRDARALVMTLEKLDVSRLKLAG